MQPVQKLSFFLATIAPKAGAFMRIIKSFDIRDVFVFGGLALLGYGLYLFEPWISFSVCGGLLMIIGYVMRGDE